MDYGKLALEAAKIGLNPTGYLLSQIAESTSKNVTHSDAAADKELATLRVEAERQELQMRISEAQARVAQEIAIARRIESAEEVEMEEFYDYSGEASVGGRVDEKGIFVGAGGSGRRVSKRIYRFRGHSMQAFEEIVVDTDRRLPIDDSLQS
ncbi:hypothetical protein [Synechococcus sp. A15-44]|uniref:hypothetical protein n=1 Tax=Synechococcus sp. A15-44 TaxID=1050646 RepID=UPI001647D810|nr:hypothetical protein [Synechococcus sp. A15-44]QNI64672.1 hypothetical protein SynA1544_50017 [Synechococcus sp. A15-44]